MKVGAAGVEFDCAANALEVCIAKEVAGQRERTVDVGDGEVAGVAFKGDGAGDAMGREGGAIVVDMRGDRAGDRTEFDVAVVGGDIDGGFDGADSDVAVVRRDGDRGAGWEGNCQISYGAVEGWDIDVEGIGRGVDLGTKLFGAVVGIGVGAGVDLLVDGDVYLVVVAGAGDGYVASGVIDIEAGGGGERLVDGLIALVFVAKELVDVIGVEDESGHVVPAAEVIVPAVADARNNEQDEQQDDSAADAVADVGDIAAGCDVVLGIAVEGPLDKQDDAYADQQKWPPAAVPRPEIEAVEAAGLNEKKDDADRDQQQRADDGAAAQAAILGAVGVALSPCDIPLRTGLLLEKAALISPILAWRRGRRVGRRIAGHG